MGDLLGHQSRAANNGTNFIFEGYTSPFYLYFGTHIEFLGITKIQSKKRKGNKEKHINFLMHNSKIVVVR